MAAAGHMAAAGYIAALAFLLAPVAGLGEDGHSMPVSTRANLGNNNNRPMPAKYPEFLGRVPSNQPIIVYADRLAESLLLAEQISSVAAHVRPSWRRSVQRARNFIAYLHAGKTSATLDTLGIDGDGPALLIPELDSKVFVVLLSLKSRQAFVQALQTIGHEAIGDEPIERFVEIGGEKAVVLDAGGDSPITCLVRVKQALCQIGVLSGDDPIASLRGLAELDSPLHQVPSFTRTFDALPKNATIYGVLNTDALAKRAQSMLAKRNAQAARFGGREHRVHAAQALRTLAQEIQQTSRLVELVGIALVSTGTGIRAEAQVALSGLGQNMAETHFASETVPSILDDWISTPALAKSMARIDRRALNEFVRHWQPHAPEKAIESFSGTLGLLVLGVDPVWSHQHPPTSLGDWLSLFPAAIALGTRGNTEEPEPWLEREFAQEKSHVEIKAKRGIVFVGTSRGMAAAAARRLEATQRVMKTKTARRGSSLAPSAHKPFFEASADLLAIKAALSGAGLGPKHLPELLKLEQVIRELEALIGHFESARLSAALTQDLQQVRVEFVLE